MPDDEEKRLKLELLALDVSLRRKQEFWETPRNIAILVGVTAAIAAAIGYGLGRQSANPPASNIQPTAMFSDMRSTELVDTIQTAGIITMAFVLIYVVVRLEKALTAAAQKIRPAIGRQQEFEGTIERLHQQATEVIERMQEAEKNFIPPRELRLVINELTRRIDALETQNESASVDNPNANP